MRSVLVQVFVSVVLEVGLNVAAEAATLFPPRTYVREADGPNDFADSFRCRSGHSARLVLENGPGGAEPASSGRVVLNGIEVIREHDFNPRVGQVHRPVTLERENTLTVRLAGKPGATVRASVVSDRPCLDVTVTEPAAGATVPAGLLLVRGIVRGGDQVGVTVNDHPAAVDGGAFAIVLPIDADETRLRAVATTSDGATVEMELPLAVTPVDEAAVRLHASPPAGPAPLVVGFSLSALVGVRGVAVDSKGNGTVDFRGPALEGQVFEFADAGLYLPTVEVTDIDGAVHRVTTVVQVYDAAALDIRLQSVWRELTAALRAGDVARAEGYIHSDARDGYVSLFTQLGAARLASIDRYMTAIHLVELGPGGAQYEMLREREGQVLSFAVWFQMDQDGVWRLRRF